MVTNAAIPYFSISHVLLKERLLYYYRRYSQNTSRSGFSRTKEGLIVLVLSIQVADIPDPQKGCATQVSIWIRIAL